MKTSGKSKHAYSPWLITSAESGGSIVGAFFQQAPAAARLAPGFVQSGEGLQDEHRFAESAKFKSGQMRDRATARIRFYFVGKEAYSERNKIASRELKKTTTIPEVLMRTLVLCLVSAAALLAAVPTSAQEFRLRGPGVDVDVGARHYRDRGYWRDRDSYRFRSERSFNRGGCRTV